MTRLITKLIFLLISFSSFCQTASDSSRFEYLLEVSYGRHSFMEALLVTESIFFTLTDLFSPDDGATREIKPTIGSIFINNQFAVDDKVELGLSIGYERIPADFLVNRTREKIGSYNYDFLIIAIEGMSVYGSNKTRASKTFFYGKVGVGYVIGMESRSGQAEDFETSLKKRRVLPQLVPVGFALNSGKWRLSAELGLGYRGAITLGVARKF